MQLFSRFTHAGLISIRGLRKHLFAYSEENPTELNALQKEYMQICKTQANSQRLHQFDNTTNYRNECKYPQKYDNGNMSRGHKVLNTGRTGLFRQPRFVTNDVMKSAMRQWC